MADTQETPTTTSTEAPEEFGAVLINLDRGKVHDDATARLAEIVKAVAHTGGKGKLKLELVVEPQDPDTFDGDGVVVVTGTVEATLPRPTRAPSVFYIDGTTRLSRTDPRRDDPRDER